MKHKRWWCYAIYTDDCACCRVRQLRYGFRLDPIGYNETRDKVWNDSKLTLNERLWILDTCKALDIEYDNS